MSIYNKEENPKCRGYTLVELLIIISVLGILAGLSVVNWNQFRANASDQVALSDYTNIKKVVYALISESEDSPYYIIFGLEGPRPLPEPLSEGVLSKGVYLTYILRLPLLGGREVIAFETRHKNGRFRYRYIEIDGEGNDQAIALR